MAVIVKIEFEPSQMVAAWSWATIWLSERIPRNHWNYQIHNGYLQLSINEEFRDMAMLLKLSWDKTKLDLSQ